MAFFTIQRDGFITVSEMMQSAINDMIDHGFTMIHPVGYDPATPITLPFTAVLEATTLVDPLAATQPWRVNFNITADQSVAAYVATPLQIKDDGTVAVVTGSSGAAVQFAGTVGKITPTLVQTDPSTGFINRASRITQTSAATFPLNYRLSITDRGFFLGAFEGNWASGNYNGQTTKSWFNWLLVQRPVNKTTGDTLVTGKCPVFCVNSVNGQYWKFVVRESDIPHPTVQVAANNHSEDSFRVINTKNQISLTEDKTYLVTFMNNLNTPRFRYVEELDMVGVVSADVVMEGRSVPFTVFGENRTYVALPGSDSFNTGVRVLAITSEA